MTRPIKNYFNVLPAELQVGIVGELKKEGVLGVRPVSKGFYGAANVVIEGLWNELKRNPPKGGLDLRAKMIEIEKDNKQSPIDKFRQLTAVFQKYGLKIPRQSVPMTYADFQPLQEKMAELNTNLKKFWREDLRAKFVHLIDREFVDEVPAENAPAEQIRSFLRTKAGHSQMIRALDLNGIAREETRGPQELPHLDLATEHHFTNKRFIADRNRAIVAAREQIKGINLACKLTVIPPEILELTGLTSLSLASNQLTALPDDIGRLKKLNYLNIHSNKLEELPESIGELRQLKKFFCNGNKIKMIPESIGNLKKLEELNLSYNKIKKFPSSIASTIGSTFIDLIGNPIQALPEGLKDNLSLDRLFLRDNCIMFIPDAVLEKFPTDPSVQKLIAERNYPSQTPLARLYQNIIKNKAPEEIDVGEIQALLHELSKKDRLNIYQMIWNEADNPDKHTSDLQDWQWGEIHAFEDMSRFCRAVYKAITSAFDTLPQERIDDVRNRVYELAGSPDTTMSPWGWAGIYAKDNIPLLADALSAPLLNNGIAIPASETAY